MLTIQEIIDAQVKKNIKPGEEDLRKLPYKKAFIYGRVSSPRQIRDSKESIREIAYLIDLAKKDSFKTNLNSAEIEQQLLSGTVGVWQDGDVIVDVCDLGLSGQLSADERKGLEHLQQEIERGVAGVIYLTEGVSRLSRDRDRILPYQLLKLLKVHECRVRTPHGVWNPVIERDEEYLAEEFEDSIGELRVMNKRLHRRRVRKAERGEYVGGPVTAGLFLPVIGRKDNGQYEYGKIEPYPLHAAIAIRVLEEFVRQNGSDLKTTQALQGVLFPLFPPELGYMAHLTALRMCPHDESGYRITPRLVRGLATNLKLIGIWTWGNITPVPGNHKAAVPQELFLQAYELALSRCKPKGRAVFFEPQDFSGLLYCVNHPVSHLVHSLNAAGRYACKYDYDSGTGKYCFDISAHFIDQPLVDAVLSQLDFTPYADEVIDKLEADAKAGQLDNLRIKQAVARLEREISQWQSLLPCCVDNNTGQVDKQKEAFYWEKIRKAQEQTEKYSAELSRCVIQPQPDFNQVREFLQGLTSKWGGYPRNFRNRLLKLLIERVELKLADRIIDATIIWKTGFTQNVTIHRKSVRRNTLVPWTSSEDAILRTQYPASRQDKLTQVLPGRSWKAITHRAARLRLFRKSKRQPVLKSRPWTGDEELQLKHLFRSGMPVSEIASELNRSVNAIETRASLLKLKSLSTIKWRKERVTWESNSPNPLHELSSGRGHRGGSSCG